MGKEIKFCNVLGGNHIPENIKDCLMEQPARSGMYNWIFVFNGEIKPYDIVKNNLEDYDVIQVNMAPSDQVIIPEIRRRLGNNSKTKLVINNDYVCEYWENWGQDPYYFDNIQRMGDMVFSTEPHQVSNMIEGAFVIPHPTNTKYLKQLGTAVESNSIGYIYHWWNPQTLLPWRLLEKVKKIHGIDKSAVYGHTHRPEDSYAKMKGYLFDKYVGLIPFPEYAQLIQGERAVYDPNGFHTYGRNGVELACWRVPVVGSNRVLSYNKLFPNLVCDPYDAHGAMDLFDKIFTQPDRMKKELDFAYDEVEWFNYENSKKRFLDALDIATKRGGHEWYQKRI